MNLQISFDIALQELHQAVQADNLAVFMGSGVSQFVNPDYPIWSGVTAELKKELPSCQSDDALEIAQEYANEFGEEKLCETVRFLFPVVSPDLSFYNELFACRPKYLLTTNWDNMLQNANDDGLQMYDTIADDKELMDSKLFNKYIKMHGDFQHERFVLTKDSFKKYSENFPLIENFVKSVLCTNTVLFIGYSLSDTDFQQILKWIEKAAPSSPNFYCAMDEKHYDEDGALKFNSNGIKTFKVPDFTKLFAELNNINVAIKSQNPIKAFASLLSPLKNDNAILLSSVRHFVTNCHYDYVNENRCYLYLLDRLATGDYNKERRKIFQNFINSLQNPIDDEQKEDIDFIRQILDKAGLSGIVYENFSKPPFQIPYSENFDKSEEYKNFDYEMHGDETDEEKIVKLAEQNSHTNITANEALEINSRVLRNAVKNRDFRKVFITYYNQNVLWFMFYNANCTPYGEQNDFINLDEKFTNLPTIIQKQILDIYDFVNENTLRDKYVYLNEDIANLRKTVDNIKKGGMAGDKERFRFANEHRNLNDFVLLNHILVEHNSLFCEVEKKYVEIALLRKSVGSTVCLNRNELFSAIKYFDWNSSKKDRLVDLLSEMKPVIKLEKSDEEWLVNTALPNCAKIYSKSAYFEIKPYFNNALCILCYCELSKDNILNVYEHLKYVNEFCMCNDATISLTFEFISSNFKKDKTVFSDVPLSVFYRIALRKILLSHSPQEYFAFINSSFYANYLCLGQQNNEQFDDVDLIKQTVDSFSNAVVDAKTNVYCNILCMLYNFGSEDCKKYLLPILEDYYRTLPSILEGSEVDRFGNIIYESYKKIIKHKYILNLININVIQADAQYISELENWLNEELNIQGYSSDIFSVLDLVFCLAQNDFSFARSKELCKKFNEKIKNTPKPVLI